MYHLHFNSKWMVVQIEERKKDRQLAIFKSGWANADNFDLTAHSSVWYFTHLVLVKNQCSGKVVLSFILFYNHESSHTS